MAASLLCPELLDMIFSFLECKDLLKVAKVSPTWNLIARLSLKRRLLLEVDIFDSQEENYFLKFRKHEPQGPAKFVEVDPYHTWRCIHGVEDIKNFLLENLRFDGQLWIPLGAAAHQNLPLLAILFMPDSWALKIKKLDFVNYGYSEDEKSDDSEDKKSDGSEDEKSDDLEDEKSDDSEDKKSDDSEDKKADDSEDEKSDDSEDKKADDSEDEKSDDSNDKDIAKSLAVQDWNVAGAHVLNKFQCLKKLKLDLKWIPDYVSTLEVPMISEAIFASIEKISIRVFELQHCQNLSLQFVTWCPNLKKFKLGGYDEDHGIHFVAAYKKLNGIGKLKLVADKYVKIWKIFFRGDLILPPLRQELVPVLKTLPFTLLELDCSVSTLQLFEASIAAKIKTLRLILHSETSKIVAKNVDCILAALHNSGFSALEDLQLHWSETDGEDCAVAHDKNDDKTDFSLPIVKRLELGGIDLGWSPANKRLLKALPNVELLVVHCATPMNKLIPENMRYPKPGIYPIRFLKYVSEFKQLRHLVWDWDFCSKNLTEQRSLRKVPKYLARLQALESLTIRLDRISPLPPLEAVVEGCAALPRMRLLQVYARPDSELAKSPELLERVISKGNSFCIRMVSIYYNLDHTDFQIDSLDKLRDEPAPE